MKKLFSALGTNWNTIIYFTVNGDFKRLKNNTNPVSFTLQKANQTNVTEANAKFFGNLNLPNLKVKTVGNPATGEGYVFTSVFRNTLAGTKNPVYSLVTIPITSWDVQPTATAQLCNIDGVTQTGETTSTGQNQLNFVEEAGRGAIHGTFKNTTYKKWLDVSDGTAGTDTVTSVELYNSAGLKYGNFDFNALKQEDKKKFSATEKNPLLLLT